MKHPQSVLKDILSVPRDKLEHIRRYGCCAFVLLWCLRLEGDDDIDSILTVARMMDAGVIGEDCTVRWADAVRYLTGRDSSVEFKAVKTLDGITRRTPVRFDFNGQEHWVGVENGRVEFNPLRNSVCVYYGRPATARILKISGVEL